MIPHEGTPVAQQVPAEWRSKILHARLIVGETVLMGSDAPADRYEAGIADPAAAERVFQALAENGIGEWRSRQPSGRPALACWSINTVRLG